MNEPAIKGSVMVNLVEDVFRLLGAKRIAEDEFESHLQPQDLEILEQKVLASTWYPIETYRRLTELMLEKEGGDEDYLRARGAGSAERLVAAGLYQEMRRLPLGRRAPSFAEVERSIRNLVTLSQMIINFGRAEVLRDPDHEKRFLIQIHEAAAYPEVLRFTSEGFYTACTRAAGRNYTWRSSRPEPDRIVMRMDRDFDA